MSGIFSQIDRFTPQNQNEAKCSFCNQHATEKLVELPDGTRELRKARIFRTSLFIHMEGWVEVCEWCLLEGAKAIGLDTDAAVDSLKQVAADWAEAFYLQTTELEESRATVHSLAAELARTEEVSAHNRKLSYEQGYAQAEADAKLESVDAG
jgi:hypothetical protein